MLNRQTMVHEGELAVPLRKNSIINNAKKIFYRNTYNKKTAANQMKTYVIWD